MIIGLSGVQLTKLDDREAGAGLIILEYDYRQQAELDNTMSCYQLIVTITISHKRKSFIWKRAFNSHF